MTIYVLTRTTSESTMYGDYFVAAWEQKPSLVIMTRLGVPQGLLLHVLNGGGRISTEDEWYTLLKE